MSHKLSIHLKAFYFIFVYTSLSHSYSVSHWMRPSNFSNCANKFVFVSPMKMFLHKTYPLFFLCTVHKWKDYHKTFLHINDTTCKYMYEIEKFCSMFLSRVKLSEECNSSLIYLRALYSSCNTKK